MEELNREELQNIKGGFLRIALAKVAMKFGVALAFAVGLINGIQNPLPCNRK